MIKTTKVMIKYERTTLEVLVVADKGVRGLVKGRE
jgi:hypothetical protein